MASVIFFTNLGNYPFFNPDEALYAEPAQEMLKSHDFVTTSLNYVTRFTKPPLTIWAMALSYTFLGVNEMAARLPCALAGYLTLIVTTLFTLKYLNSRTALITCFTLAMSPLFIVISREAITDMVLTLFTTLAGFNLFTSFKENKNPYLAYIMIALAIMTKGPIGLVLPVGGLGLFYILTGQVKANLKKIKWLELLLILTSLALPWYVVEIYVTKGAYFKEFILRENFARFTGVVDSHKGSIWYHPVVFMVGFFPWSIFFINIIFKLSQDFNLKFTKFTTKFLSLNNISQYISTIIHDMPQLEIILYCFCQTIFTICFFSASVSKLIPYTLPAYPFAAIILGYYLPKLNSKELNFNYAGLFIVACLAYAILPKYFYKLRDTTPEINGLILNCLLFTIATSLIYLLINFFNKAKMSLIVFCLLNLFLLANFGTASYSLISDTWEKPVKEFALALKDKKNPIILYDLRKPSVMFYAERKILIPLNYGQFLNCLKLYPNAYIITKSKDINKLNTLPNLKLIETKGMFSLFYNSSLQ